MKSMLHATPAHGAAPANDLQEHIDQEAGQLAMREAFSEDPLKNKLPDPLVSIIGGYLDGPAKPSP